MKYKIFYNAYYVNSKKRRSWHCFSEVITAGGLMHAARLGKKHAKELSKTLSETIKVADIDQIIEKKKEAD